MASSRNHQHIPTVSSIVAMIKARAVKQIFLGLKNDDLTVEEIPTKFILSSAWAGASRPPSRHQFPSGGPVSQPHALPSGMSGAIKTTSQPPVGAGREPHSQARLGLLSY